MPRTDIGGLVEAYQSQIRRVSNQSFELDVPETFLESAWLGDWEASYDIAIRQFRTYCYAVRENNVNPAWTAVTGYYASFFAVRSLLYATGVGQR